MICLWNITQKGKNKSGEVSTGSVQSPNSEARVA